VVIKSLKRNTMYQVRTVLLLVLDTVDNSTYAYSGLDVPYTNVTTECIVIGEFAYLYVLISYQH
jgi:hypothetical protein